jgi:hypothetical protein
MSTKTLLLMPLLVCYVSLLSLQMPRAGLHIRSPLSRVFLVCSIGNSGFAMQSK